MFLLTFGAEGLVVGLRDGGLREMVGTKQIVIGRLWTEGPRWRPRRHPCGCHRGPSSYNHDRDAKYNSA